MARLQGKKVFITGGNSGIGLATAQAFVEEGAEVMISGRNPETLEQAAASLGEAGTAVQGDVSNLEDIDRWVEAARERWGKLDVLFANAGVAKLGALGDLTEEHVDEHYTINVKGLVFTVQKFLPLLEEGASIILMGSGVDSRGTPGMAIYSSTKSAVRSLTRSFAAELAPRGIRVNAIGPGPIETPIFSRMGLPEKDLQDMGQQIQQQVTLGRFGKPGEIAAPMVMLASDESSFMTGSEVYVDGGYAQI